MMNFGTANKAVRSVKVWTSLLIISPIHNPFINKLNDYLRLVSEYGMNISISRQTQMQSGVNNFVSLEALHCLWVLNVACGDACELIYSRSVDGTFRNLALLVSYHTGKP